MTKLDDLVKLQFLREKGIITEAEFEKEKEKLLIRLKIRDSRKSQLVYVLLAFLFGIFGIHNFYLRRWKQGLGQLLLTTLTLSLGIIITALWTIINILTTHTDGRGNQMEPCPVAKYVFLIWSVINYLGFAAMYTILWFGIVTGYTNALHRAQFNQFLQKYKEISIQNSQTNVVFDYAQKVHDLIQNESIEQYKDCSDVLPLPDELSKNDIYCVVDTNRIAISGLNKITKLQMKKDNRVKETEKGNIIISFYPENK